MSRYRPASEPGSSMEGQALRWWVILDDGRETGTIWLEGIAASQDWRLGMLLGSRDAFGKGLGTAALRLVQAELQTMALGRRILLNVRMDNPRAIACYTKAGFTRVGVWTKVLADGTACEVLSMAFQVESRFLEVSSEPIQALPHLLV